MDLTFGVNSTKCLVCIIMAIDHLNRGIPLAFIIFTPLKHALAARASYDGAILEDLLSRFKLGMGTNEDGEEFDPYVGNTDNDPRERNALTVVWSNIFLLLCLFHIWQAWWNGLNRFLRVLPQGSQRQDVSRHLGKFLMRLLKEITDYPEALEAYNLELVFFRKLGVRSNSLLDQKRSKAGLAFLGYLQTYLKSWSFWLSWSKAGVLEAAHRMNVPVEKVAQTTNHLESFNGRLKGKHAEVYQHSGRLPCIDRWVLNLITKVMPDFFEEYDERLQSANYFHDMRQAAPKSDLRSHHCPSETPDVPSKSPPSIPTITPVVSDISEGIEMDLMDLLIDDEDDEGNLEEIEDFEPGEVEDIRDLSLQLDSDGEHSSFLTDSSEDSIDDWEAAMDASSIIGHLPEDTSILFPFTSAQTPTSPTLDMLPVDLDIDLLALKIPDTNHTDICHSNKEAIAWQEVQVAEDYLLDRLRNVLLVSTDPNTLQLIAPHISPRIQSQLLNDSTPPQSPSSSIPSPQLKISQSPTISLPIVEATVPSRIQAFLPQLKEHRKESHGIR